MIVCLSFHAYHVRTHASPAIEISAVGRVLTSIRIMSYEERRCVIKRENVPRVLLLTNKKHECNKPCCANCKENMEIGHLSYMAMLKNELPRSDNVLFSMISKPLKIRNFPIRQLSVTVKGNIRSGTILSEI